MSDPYKWILDWQQRWPDGAYDSYMHRGFPTKEEAIAHFDVLLLDGFEVPFAQVYPRYKS